MNTTNHVDHSKLTVSPPPTGYEEHWWSGCEAADSGGPCVPTTQLAYERAPDLSKSHTTAGVVQYIFKCCPCGGGAKFWALEGSFQGSGEKERLSLYVRSHYDSGMLWPSQLLSERGRPVQPQLAWGENSVCPACRDKKCGGCWHQRKGCLNSIHGPALPTP